MSFHLHFSGPSSFEQTVTLKPGPAIVVGRDPEAAVYLPDTERLISRRHVSIEWTPEGARLQVLSANGINTDHGDYFNGDEVVLADGESARIGSFSLIVSAVQQSVDLDATSFSGMGTRPVPAGPVTRAAPEKDADPWADLMSQHSPRAVPPPEPPPEPPAPPAFVPSPAPVQAAAPTAHDDPFFSSASWRMGDGLALDAGADPFSRSFVGTGAHAELAGTPAPTPRAPAAPENFALQALCRGLGVDMPPNAVNFDWEHFGGAVRHVVQCLGDHIGTRMDAKRDMRAEDRTMLGAKETNPLKAGMPVNEMVTYLLLTPDGVGGFTPANRALQEMAEEARSHEHSVHVAAKGLAEGALREFDPAKLRGTLLKGKLSMTSLVDNARLWDLYTGHYAGKARKLSDWSEQLFNKYYMAAYLREVERLRRSRMPAPAPRTE